MTTDVCCYPLYLQAWQLNSQILLSTFCVSFGKIQTLFTLNLNYSICCAPNRDFTVKYVINAGYCGCLGGSALDRSTWPPLNQRKARCSQTSIAYVWCDVINAFQLCQHDSMSYVSGCDKTVTKSKVSCWTPRRRMHKDRLWTGMCLSCSLVFTSLKCILKCKPHDWSSSCSQGEELCPLRALYNFSVIEMTYLILRPNDIDAWVEYHVSQIHLNTFSQNVFSFTFESFKRSLEALNKICLIPCASPVPVVISLKLILAVAPYFSYGCV